MFAKANWAILGLEQSSLERFRERISHPLVMLAVSQIAALSCSRREKVSTMGINPFRDPRLDDCPETGLVASKKPDISEALLKKAFDAISTGDEEGDYEPYSLPNLEAISSGLSPEHCDEMEETLFGMNDAFRLSPNANVYGLWIVANDWKDANHVKSLREQKAYETFQRPYAFLSAGDVKDIETEVKLVTNRKQFPVILDFDAGRIYLEETNKKILLDVKAILTTLGVEIKHLAWQFPTTQGHWPSAVLNALFKDTAYSDEYAKRAYEVQTMSRDEYEIIEDPITRGVVYNSFSTTNTSHDNWVSLTTPALIEIVPKDDVVLVRTDTNATRLLGIDSRIFSASVVMQEEISTMKNDVEKRFRVDQITFNVNDSLNIVDAGAAALPGFHLPNFVRSEKKEIRKSKTVPPIGDLWLRWGSALTDATNRITEMFRISLQVPEGEDGGLLPTSLITQSNVEEFSVPPLEAVFE